MNGCGHGRGGRTQCLLSGHEETKTRARDEHYSIRRGSRHKLRRSRDQLERRRNCIVTVVYLILCTGDGRVAFLVSWCESPWRAGWRGPGNAGVCTVSTLWLGPGDSASKLQTSRTRSTMAEQVRAETAPDPPPRRPSADRESFPKATSFPKRQNPRYGLMIVSSV